MSIPLFFCFAINGCCHPCFHIRLFSPTKQTKTSETRFIYGHWVSPERERGGTMNCLLLVSKVLRFLIGLLNNFLGNLSFILIGWFSELSIQTFQPLVLILCIIIDIGDVHQFIGHCLIAIRYLIYWFVWFYHLKSFAGLNVIILFFLFLKAKLFYN